MKLLIIECLIGLLPFAVRAATFNVTPNVVSNDYTGPITFQMSGLAPGATVQVVQFYDFNGNGVIDGADLPVRGEQVTDGQAETIGGVTNVNVLRDEDGAADGAIRGSLRFELAPELANGVGHYLFRFSSPSNQFTAATVPFTVVNRPYGQKVQGVVQSNGTNVPYAGVELVQIVGGRTKPIVGGAADATGSYTLEALPDTYWVIAFWPGYVMDFNAAPYITLAAGGTVTTNLSLISATSTLSGTLVDSDNTTLPVLPYSQLTAFTADHLFTITTADSNANYSVGVTPGLWTVRPRWQSAITKSYLVPEPGSFTERSFDTSGGSVAYAAVALKRATALIYGTVEDNHTNAIPGITVSANADGGAFDALGLSDADGRYALAIDAGGGFVNVENPDLPPADKYLWTGDYFYIAEGQALNVDVTGIVPTAHFLGQLLDDSGEPVGQFLIFANNNRGGTSLTTTDTNGFFNLPVFGGTWQLYPDSGLAQQRSLIFPPCSFQITNGINLTKNIVVQRATGQISGYVRDLTNAAISGLYVSFSTTVGSISYNLYAYTDGSGSYSLPVFNGTWTVSLAASPYDLLSRGYNPANPVNLTVPPTNGVANFILIPIGPASGPPQIATTSLPDAFVGQAYYQTLVVTNASQPLSWSLASGALPAGLRLDSPVGSISGTPTDASLASFTLQVTDARGSNTTSALSINVLPAQVQAPWLDLPALLPGGVFSVRATGVAGQSYTLQSASSLTNWTDLLTTNAPGNVFYLQDTRATDAVRLYRLKVNP
ncbi:MAG: putative Ig domain-containing protein [Verrucomicrobiota bacterium]|jgi:hypothetical protein